jgi:hypothetical protein
MELVAFIIALAIAHRALRGYRLTGQKTFWYVYFGFAVLSSGLLVDSLVGFLGMLARVPRGTVALTQVGYSIYFFSQLLAYGLLIYAYASQTRNLRSTSSSVMVGFALFSAALQTTPAPPIGLLGLQLEYHPIAEIVLLFLVAYVTVHTGMNYSTTKDGNALLVFLAFLFLTLSHLFFILTPISPLSFVIGHTLQLSGFVSLLAMLLQVSGTR